MSLVTTLGRPATPPLAELAARRWDAVIVGGGHNGLTAAAYLARAGRSVLVLEAREQLGGACTLREPWAGYRVSPCAYLAGLLHPVVIDELELRRRGFRWIPADGGLFVPFEDGSSVQLWEDDARLEAELARFAPGDLAGYRAMSALMDRVREALRPADERDVWLGAAPSRERIAELVDHDEEALGLLFTWSQAEMLERYLDDERLRAALMGQGVIGTNASPFDAGTASIHFHHSSGRIDPDRPGTWGFVEGGMGTVSFLIADAAQEAGAVLAAGVPVAGIEPGRGVLLDDGTLIEARDVVVGADPQVAARLLGDAVDAGWRAQVDAVPIRGCTVKVTLALSAPPRFTARPDSDEHQTAQINTPLTDAQWRDGFAAASRGELPELLWTEDYLQTAYDPSIAPPGKHLLSVFAQYVPYDLDGGWDARRDEVGALAVRSIARFCDGFEDAIEGMEVLGPPDIEREVGLTGGHIFQGECLPEHMWDRRLTPATPMDGVWLAGAGTYPGGSVMGINGRNAAMAVLGELR
ncbi:MAG: NAD(P)/FAD-dependent oxidoreductase [Nitriliruptoraceae bacterium]|nr:NAD(P)/FAD-dependent oxidoreductase [Nitriliruptoraceae bacterium]